MSDADYPETNRLYSLAPTASPLPDPQGPLPDLGKVRDVLDFADAAEALRIRAGGMSFAEISRRFADRRPSHTTVRNWVASNQFPVWETVDIYVRALGAQETLEQWYEAWQRVATTRRKPPEYALRDRSRLQTKPVNTDE